MTTTQTVVLALAAVALVNAVVFGVMAVVRIRRMRVYQAWAAKHGMQYARRDDSWLTRCAWGRPFGWGTGHRAIDVVTGTYQGRPAVYFTYRYTTRRPAAGEDGGKTDRNYIGVSSLQLPHPVPELRVTKPVFPYRQPGTAGFAATYQITGVDRAFAEQVLHPGLQHFILSNDLAGFDMVADRIFLRTQRQSGPDRIEHYWDLLTAIIEHTPDAVGLR